MKHIIFSDIDGTIYNLSKIIDPQTSADIKFAQNLGIEFILSTGNGYFKNIKNLAKQFNCRYVINSNGAGIFDLKKNDFILEKMIPYAVANEILAFAMKQKLAANWWDKRDIFTNKYSSQEIRDIISQVMVLDQEILVTDKVLKDVFKIEFFGDANKVKQMAEFIKAQKFELEVAQISPIHMEVTFLNVSKGDAIAWMAQEFNFALDNTMGIGDSTNDVTMLETVKYSYAMANGTNNVKTVAKYHTSTVEQNGLGEAIQDFVYKLGIGK